MHLVVAVLRVIWMGLLERSTAVVTSSRYRDWVDRKIVAQAILAFYAGAGLDDAACEIVRGLGPRAAPILEATIAQGRHADVARLLLQAARQR